MKRLCCLLCLSVAPFLHATAERSAALAQAQPLRIIAFGAHPDDAELKASGVAALWAAAGHKVKFVAMTNGDVGHFGTAGGPLARRRAAEVAECARILGIETEVMDIHDGELTPSLENRKTMARLIRSWQADIVMGHRPYDYHPDHRYTGVLMDDSAVVVVAPFFVPDTPPTRAESRLHVLLGRVSGPEAIHAEHRRRHRRRGREEMGLCLGDAVAVRRRGFLAGAHAGRTYQRETASARPICSIS